ncbi:MAG: hypothetical protein BWY68_00870 [bacterium ADurb.Bin400]|nr:MAG: hypothetical protein BWY68_00870 [bacterium ADurb.Bin400]
MVPMVVFHGMNRFPYWVWHLQSWAEKPEELKWDKETIDARFNYYHTLLDKIVIEKEPIHDLSALMPLLLR